MNMRHTAMSGKNQGTSVKVCLKMLTASIFITTFLCPPGCHWRDAPGNGFFF